MDIGSIATIVATILGSFGGLEFIKWLGSRKKNEVDWMEERLTQRDLKIDALYIELRQEQAAKLEEIHKRHEAELALKDAENNRCDRPDSDCGRRIPPRVKLDLKDKNKRNEKERSTQRIEKQQSGEHQKE